ncbi:MAG: PD-(D/E)XK nuclease family protein [Armatimonadetes bacterium]|nr:PD-(D/E)XK nuclease family protein [Armatimonadota bacterium]
MRKSMARKPTLSPTKITTYLACPTKYHWTYVDSRGRYFLRSKSYYSFGSTLHSVLQRFHDQNDSGVETVAQAVASVEESWIEAGYSSAQEAEEALGEGKEIIATYVGRYLEEPSEGVPILVEKLLRFDLGDFALIGRVDRVDEHPDGSLEIIDYKSGRSDVSATDVANDLAMACYQLLLKRMYPDRQVRATIIAIRTGNQASASLPVAALDEFEQDIRVLGQEILNRNWEDHVAVAKSLCNGCDFLALCRRGGLILPEDDPESNVVFE